MSEEKDLAHELSDKELQRLERRFRSVYVRANKEVLQTTKNYFEAFKLRDAEQVAAVKAGEITARDLANWRMNQMLIGERWITLARNLSSEYAKANKIALALVNDKLPDVYALGHNFAAYTLEHGAGMNLNFMLYDRHTVEQLVKNTPKLLPTKRLDIPKDQLWNQKRITAEMLQGVLQGDSVGHLADRLQRVTDMNRDSSLRNARTCITGAENGGRLDSYREAQKKGIKLKKEWLATLDDRTRVSHQELDGEKVELDKPFSNGLMYPGDPDGAGEERYNCRCTLISSIEGMKEVEPVYRRDNINGERIADMSYKQWYAARQAERKFSRNMAGGLRRAPGNIITDEEQKALLVDIADIGADASAFRFNTGRRTGYDDETGIINVRGDVFPDLTSVKARDTMTTKAVLAHEYYGHYAFAPSCFPVNDWRDEMRASYVAALKAPNLSRTERTALLVDAYDRAREAGQYFEYSKWAKEIIYGN